LPNLPGKDWMATSDQALRGKPAFEIASAVTFNFICYITLGLPLAVLPGYVHLTLGYSEILAGLVISVQYMATLATRPSAGRMADSLGPKKTVLSGLAGCGASGILLVLAAATDRTAWLSLIALFASRLVLGFGESGSSTGSIMWAIRRVGTNQTARVISWNGITSYGGMAIGAPLGVAIDRHFGLGAIGFLVIACSLVGLGLALLKPAVEIVRSQHLPFHQVFRRVMPYGLALGLATAGFGAIATFITLYYASRHWPDAAYALTCFGACFMGMRMLLPNAINRFGGFRVATLSFLVETAGLLLLWQASTPIAALEGAALTGCGLSLIFPSLAVEALQPMPTGNRGAALATYTVFFDLALGLAGPVDGFIAGKFGYADVFLVTAVGVLAGMALTLALSWRTAPRPADGTANINN
jgi:MFS family permease